MSSVKGDEMRVPMKAGSRCAALVRATLVVACFAGATGLCRAQADRPSDEDLQSLAERGRLIALYMQAVDRTAGILKVRGAGAPATVRTVVIPETSGWRVVCLGDQTKTPGATGAAHAGPVIVAETTFSPDAGQVGTLETITPPRQAPATIQSYARALEEAENATVGASGGGGAFADAVLREKDSTFTVYVISQSPEPGSPTLLVGRDFMVRVAASGRQVLSVDKLHDSATEVSLQPRAPGTPVLHQHDKGDLPSPTDVALVLSHPVLAPLLVLTNRSIFRVDREGAVTWLGPNTGPTPAAPGKGAP
jgi:hypothetical protein